MSSFRDLLAWDASPTKQLVRGARLNAMTRAVGRTRTLGAMIEGELYTVTSATASSKVRLRVNNIRGGTVVASGWAYVTVPGTNGHVRVTLRAEKVSDSSLVDEHVSQNNFASEALSGAFNLQISIPPGIDVYVYLIFETLGTSATGVFRDWTLYETVGSPAQNGDLWTGVPEANYAPSDFLTTFAHRDTANSSTDPGINDVADEYPKCQMLWAQRFAKVHSTNSSTLVLVSKQHVDPFLGDYAVMVGALKVDADAGRVQLKVENEAQTVSDVFTSGSIGDTSYVRFSDVADLTALPNNGDLVGSPGWLSILIQNVLGGGGNITYMKGARLYNGMDSDPDEYLKEFV